MDHMGTKTLETSRLILRQFRKDDVNAMYENWSKDEEVTRNLMWPAHKSAYNNQGVCDAAWYGLLREDYYVHIGL